MPGGRRGLVAPQNTFLDNVMKRLNQNPDTSFLIGNAKIIDFPIVYVSDEFSRLVGYRKSDIMLKPLRCDFLTGPLTDSNSMEILKNAFEQQTSSVHEMLYYKKNGTGIWLEVELIPVKNESNIVVLFICTFRDITSFKDPFSEVNMFSGLSKFAKIAWTLTRSRNAANNKQATPLNQDLNREAMANRERIAFGEVPNYKHEPPQTPPHILLHYCAFKKTWDSMILFLTFYTVIIVPYNLAINRPSQNYYSKDESVGLLVIDSIVDIIFFIDIIFNFHTSFVSNTGEVITNEKKIRSHYLRSGFVIDLMACLPYDALNAFSPNSSFYTHIFSILKVMRLFRLGRVARSIQRFLESSFQLLILMMGFYLIVCHWFACAWFVIGKIDLEAGRTYGWLSILANKTGKDFKIYVDKNGTTQIEDGPDPSSMYVTALYFTMTCMTSIGFGNVAADTDTEKTFTLCMMIVSSLLYAAIFGHVTTIIHNMTLATAKYHEMLDGVREFMILNEVPKNLTERVVDYVVSKWTNTKGVEPDKVLSICPKDMRADICVHLNRRVFNGHPAFRLASDGCLRSLATNFKMTHCAPGDFIIRKGESITDLIFVVSGSLEVVQDGEILAFLGTNDVCGDSHWKETRLGKSVVHVRALTYCDIHTINVDDLLKVLEFHKPFAITFSRNLCLTFDLSKRVVFSKVIDKKLEKLYEQVNHLENPLTPNQVVLLKKVVNKFKSKVRTPIEEEKEVSPLLSSSRGSSPRQVSQHSLAIPLVSPVASSQANTRPRPTWGKFLRKTSEQMLGMNSQTKELPDVQEVTKTEELESSSKHLAGLINDYRSEVKNEIQNIENKISNIEKMINDFIRVQSKEA